MNPDLEGDGEGAGSGVGGGGARGGGVPDGAADPGDEGTHLHNTGNKALNECPRSFIIIINCIFSGGHQKKNRSPVEGFCFC